MNSFEFGLIVALVMLVGGGIVVLMGFTEGVFISIMGLVPLFIGAFTVSFTERKQSFTNVEVKEN